ncbi:TIGR04438 family Trp-rich protein [Limnobacter sp.]|uniref:TIGR04438 family Trp-rich protein n=1 Tax=Limnobacter sp. TaxID=2003368 RepID=UPI002588CEB8|nr:TIGR04438 family Trp-rich protein [Limnobacter sp.]HEX5487491.1 TIGR04438 family Trp-rich protein [Limnobacter sp.]
MIFLLFGFLLLVLKLSQIEPVSQWTWIMVSLPFAVAVVWMELIEPLMGLDALRQRREQKRFLARFDRDKQTSGLMSHGQVTRLERKSRDAQASKHGR